MAAPRAHKGLRDDEVRARIAQYEAWAERLGRTRDDYARRMPTYRRFFYGLTAAGFACFAFGVFPGLWGAISGTGISLGGYGMLRSRFWELDAEIAEVQRELRTLRAMLPAAVS